MPTHPQGHDYPKAPFHLLSPSTRSPPRERAAPHLKLGFSFVLVWLELLETGSVISTSTVFLPDLSLLFGFFAALGTSSFDQQNGRRKTCASLRPCPFLDLTSDSSLQLTTGVCLSVSGNTLLGHPRPRLWWGGNYLILRMS